MYLKKCHAARALHLFFKGVSKDEVIFVFAAILAMFGKSINLAQISLFH